ncbi:large-conductance mechanosensitive channel [Zopfochytrium polystomum]|nr:large-conductance mechanosensitive channel [Zopfochytrium polystomum]
MADDTIHSDVEKQGGFKKAGQAVGSGLKKTGAAAFSVLEDFKNFINRGNVVDLAVGVVMGTAFTSIVNSLVNDLVTPIIGLATQNNLEQTFLVIRCGKSANCTTGSNHGYASKAAATADGAVTWNWGNFIQTLINFILISVVVFFLVKLYSAAFLRKKKVEAPKTKECEECCEKIDLKAKKCKFCGSPAPEYVPPEVTAPEHHGFSITSPFKRSK